MYSCTFNEFAFTCDYPSDAIISKLQWAVGIDQIFSAKVKLNFTNVFIYIFPLSWNFRLFKDFLRSLIHWIIWIVENIHNISRELFKGWIFDKHFFSFPSLYSFCSLSFSSLCSSKLMYSILLLIVASSTWRSTFLSMLSLNEDKYMRILKLTNSSMHCCLSFRFIKLLLWVVYMIRILQS